jgi:hypothetical protein
MNAKQELIDILHGKSNTLCAEIHTENKVFILKKNYTKKDWDSFIEKLDFKYQSIGSKQNIFGTVWLQDGSWFKRIWECNNFNCVEHWEYHQFPKIPKTLTKN